MQLQEKNIDVKKQPKFATDNFNELLLIIATFVFFMFVTVVFYSFSQSKDIAIKKSMGYSNFNITWIEVKKCFKFFIYDLLVIIALVFILLGLFFDFKSTLIFLKILSIKIILFIIALLVIFIIAFWINSAKCSTSNIKGKNRNKELFAFTCIVKTILFVVLTVFMSQSSDLISELYNNYKMTKNTAEKVNGYYKTTVNVTTENPETNLDEYTDKLIKFYKLLHDNNNCIIAEPLGEKAQGYKGHQIIYSVNDNSIDYNDIYDCYGNKIESKDLSNKKLTILIPNDIVDFDYHQIEKQCQKHYKMELSDVDLIKYKPEKSSIFSFDNTNNTENNGYYSDVIIFVFNENIDPLCNLQLYDWLSSGMFFKTNTDKDAYQEIYPYLEECGLTNIVLETPSVSDNFQKELNSQKQLLIYQLIYITIYFFALIVLIIYSSELYYINNSKEISIKTINGYGFINIFKDRMIFKASVIIIIAILNLLKNISLLIAFTNVSLELIIFSIIMVKQRKSKIVETIKGE